MMCFDSSIGNMLSWLFSWLSRKVAILWHAVFNSHASFEMLKTQIHHWIFTFCIMQILCGVSAHCT